MSNAGQAVLTIAGTVIGFYIGYPQLGFVLGSLAGNALFPTQLPGVTGPQLNDHNTTQTEIGGAVAEILGTIAVAPTVLWLGPVEEVATTTEVGGKGGPSQDQTTFTYFQPIALGLCRAPPGGQMGGISRIWENGKLVYDIRSQQAGESSESLTTRLAASTEYAATFVLYLGPEDQMPDPTIEMVEGVGQVPAFRELMYIVYPRRQLKDDQGRRHPNWKFEVFEEGGVGTAREYSNYVVYDWSGGSDPRNSDNVHSYEYAAGVGDARWTLDYGVAQAAREAVSYENYVNWSVARGFSTYEFGSNPYPDLDINFGPHDGSANEFNTPAVVVYFNTGMDPSSSFANTLPSALCAQGIGADRKTTAGLSQSFTTGVTTGPLPNAAYWSWYELPGDGFISHGLLTKVTEHNTVAAPSPSQPGCTSDPSYIVFSGLFYGPAVVSVAPDVGLTIRRVPQAPAGTGWALYNDGPFRVLQSYTQEANTGLPITQPVGPALRFDDPFYDDEAYWTGLYLDAVANNQMDAGLTYGSEYPTELVEVWSRPYTSNDGADVSIADIIRRVSLRCGFSLSEIDVTDLEDRYVHGFGVQRVMTGRDAIAAVIPIGFFDVVESGDLIKFPVRGKGIVATLATTDLGAHAAGSAFPVAVKSAMAQDVELPRQVRFHYIATSRDYEPGEQLSLQRISTDAQQVIDVSAAVAIDDTMALQCADVLWADAWSGRWSHEIALDRSYLWLEGADCVNLPVRGRYERVRIVQTTDQSSSIRNIKLLADNDGSYVSTRIAADPERADNILNVYQQTELILLDIPALRDTDDTAGFYAAVLPTGSGTQWVGAIIWKSLDGSGGWTSVASAANAATVGTIVTPPGAGITDTWDEENTIVVTIENGTLSTKTEAEVIAGDNAAAIGSDGRWEIVQFREAEQISTTQWRLSGLLRGRRGTEYLVAGNQVGDRFVLVSGAGVVRIGMDIGEIGQNRVYRAVSAGKDFTSGIDQTFAGHAEALVPFSPVDLQAVNTGDIVFTWIRRARLGRTLMSGTDIPLSEESERYEVDIEAAGSPSSVVRTLSATTQTATYTTAQQLTDLGSPSPAGFTYRVYQLSATVGRGTPSEATV